MGIYAKYKDIDGQCKDMGHETSIKVMSMDWGAHTPGARSGGSYVADDLSLTFEFDLAAPKLAEKLLMGEKIDELKVEVTATYGDKSVQTYITILMTNIFLSSFHTSGSGEAGKPIVTVGNSAETVEINYQEYNETDGAAGGNADLTVFNLVTRGQ